eukprot:COSAG01_NODE_3507_length_5991_cov_3.993268_2_plen_329_part_00
MAQRRRCFSLGAVEQVRPDLGKLRVTLPDASRVDATLVAFNEASGHAVALYDKQSGAIALPIGLLSEHWKGLLRTRWKEIAAAERAVRGAHALHDASHFDAAVYERGGSVQHPALAIVGELKSAAERQNDQMLCTSVRGLTCDEAMRTTLCERVVYAHKGHRRRYAVLGEYLGTRDPLRDMQVWHQRSANAKCIAMLGADSEFVTHRTRLRVLRETLFGAGSCRSVGNLWVRGLASRAKLLDHLCTPPACAAWRVPLVRRLRGLLGYAEDMPALGGFIVCNGVHSRGSAGGGERPKWCICGLRHAPGGAWYTHDGAGLNGGHRLCGGK